MNNISFRANRHRAALPIAGLLLMAVLFSSACVTQGSSLPEDVLLRESFGEEYSLVGKPTRWYWVPYASEIWTNEAEDVPEGYGPWVLTLGRGSNSTAHIALKPEILAGETDYEVSVLWVDRTVVGELNDSDFHVGVRAQPTSDMELETPEKLYEIEVDGDKADATNLIPDDGPTHFHLFIRGDVQRALDHATADEFPQPVRDQWYWTRMRVVGSTLQAKTWAHGNEEPDWMLFATDADNRYPTGTIRLGVWSGKAEVAFVEVRRAESSVALGMSEDDSTSIDESAPWESALFARDEPASASGGASDTIPQGQAKNAIVLRGIEDAWVRDVTVTGFQLSGVLIETGSRITVSNVAALDPIHEVVPGFLYNFNASKAAQQILFTQTHASNGRHHYISNGMSWTSGIVFHRTTSTGAWSTSEGHRRWTMGLLFDAHSELDGPRAGGTPILLGLYNRGDYGTGHGPFDQPGGYLEGNNRSGLTPESLYEAQLFMRLGGLPQLGANTE